MPHNNYIALVIYYKKIEEKIKKKSFLLKFHEKPRERKKFVFVFMGR